jgi:hypothetical protein
MLLTIHKNQAIWGETILSSFDLKNYSTKHQNTNKNVIVQKEDHSPVDSERVSDEVAI